ncbi:MAG: YraN family protein [Saprospiraceae bacterium]|nr:YraN family protein [Candidatus Brachybacter algidus]MBK8747925.1 YraN family protein [Candidatus Brachybacter algidus]
MTKESKKLGERGEAIAADYLLKKGYSILERNWRWKRAEIDLIAMRENTLVMVEVKTRSYTFFGTPDAFVTDHKEAMMLDAGYQYALLIEHEWSVQLDIIGIVMNEDDSYTLKHLEDVYFPTFE